MRRITFIGAIVWIILTFEFEFMIIMACIGVALAAFAILSATSGN